MTIIIVVNMKIKYRTFVLAVILNRKKNNYPYHRFSLIGFHWHGDNAVPGAK